MKIKTIKDIFTAYGPEYVHRFGGSIPKVHHKVIEAIVNCRTETYGISVYECEACAEIHRIFRSYGNRSALADPTCQNHKIKKWLHRQLMNQLPGHHFMVTFTVPEQLRRFIRSNQKLCYAAPQITAFLPLTNTLIAYLTGLLEQWIENDLAGRFNPQRLDAFQSDCQSSFFEGWSLLAQFPLYQLFLNPIQIDDDW